MEIEFFGVGKYKENNMIWLCVIVMLEKDWIFRFNGLLEIKKEKDNIVF